MTEVLSFEIHFHGPFRVATGAAEDGLDAVLDMSDPLPGSSLKGLMRDVAEALLRADSRLINQVFGSEADESPWVWCGALPVGTSWGRASVRTRLEIDDETHTAKRDLVAFSQILEPVGPARFEIMRRGAVAPGALSAHTSLLRASAAGVKHVGAERRRGLGWVTVVPQEPIAAADLARVRAPGGSNA